MRFEKRKGEFVIYWRGRGIRLQLPTWGYFERPFWIMIEIAGFEVFGIKLEEGLFYLTLFEFSILINDEEYI